MESHNNNESLLSDSPANRSDSFIRRTSFIPPTESDTTQDERSLIEMGFDEIMVKKVYMFLKPRHIIAAIELMTEVEGIMQHDYYDSKSNLCFICKKGKKLHRDYREEENVYIPVKDERKNIQLDRVNSIKKEEELDKCLICFEMFKEENGSKLPCGHCCCNQCLYQYLKTEISNAKVTQLKCFYRNCSNLLNEQFVLEHLSNDTTMIDKYKIFKQRAAIFLSNDKKFCPEPDCNSYLQEDQTNKYVQCENGHKYCYICLKQWHGESPCDEELDKDFQIWKKDKVVKQCPRCKIYTEKNEGCNHMTCTECKYQWCWLCEGKYQEGHFRTGQCNGLQFVKINYLSERPKHVRIYNDAHPPSYRERHHNQEDRQEGCCMCNRNILNRYWFIHSIGPLNWYYGNKIITFIISLLTVLFLLVPVVAVALIYDVGDVYFESFTSMHNFFIILISISLFICYQFSVTCITLLVLIISLPIPEKNLNLVRFIWEKGKNHWIFTVY